ncbi:MAG: AAA family ATPase [Bacteroidales bacterium]|nr:AAA family ATPase [Bacteroidales bacterium]
MIKLPSIIAQRNELDCRLGIKSSLSGIASVVALSYLLYCANGKKSYIIYADEVEQSNGKKKLVLKDSYKKWIVDNYSLNDDVLDNNPLLTSQLEALQVGLGLMFHLSQISYVDYPTTYTKERTGGERFRKVMKFALNMKYIDLYLSAWPNEILKSEITLWLNNSPSHNDLSIGLKQILTAFSEETQFKIRAQGQEILFQQVGIYCNIFNNDNVVAKDEQEDVGPFRVFKSFVREGLHPFLTIENNVFSNNSGESLEDYKEMVDTTLNLSSKKIVLYQEDSALQEIDNNKLNDPYQIIFYGALGTGKSHAVENDYVQGNKSFRITFHPDTDYASFVGCYKPTMCGTDDSQITYSFVPQVFLKSYVYAWNNPDKKTFLVIEELNRGNCAQIFGDIFQLLDRRADEYAGYSKYAVNADTDIAKYLQQYIVNDEYESTIRNIYKPEEDIFDFSLMALPDNLYILATMNTSDQSLFPIDSAFKRRWEMEYVKVNYEDAAKFKLELDDQHLYSWDKVLEGLNGYIKRETNSTNKIIGNRFAQAKVGDIIDLKTFRDKVLFFLFNDVFKDNDDFIRTFFGTDAENMFFEDLCESDDIQPIVRFVEDVCKARNLKEENNIAEETPTLRA